jgi:hypothetical protein
MRRRRDRRLDRKREENPRSRMGRRGKKIRSKHMSNRKHQVQLTHTHTHTRSHTHTHTLTHTKGLETNQTGQWQTTGSSPENKVRNYQKNSPPFLFAKN